MSRRVILLVALGLIAGPAHAQGAGPRRQALACAEWSPADLRRNPTEHELRCRYGATGPGRFGLLSYVDLPVYQPATPMPGTHLVGVAGHAAPEPGESYEAWEWRMLRRRFGPEAHQVHRGLELLDPFVASRIVDLEARLAAERIRAVRRETWRAPERQAYLFQQGRSRPGPLATATLTSWHSQVDARGNPAGRAVDYEISAAHLRRFHELARAVGLDSFGADSNDPGHVFLPDEDALSTLEIVLLRTLARVPEVTLATGLPVDRSLDQGARAEVRAAAEKFAAEPFVPFAVPSLAGAPPHPPLIASARVAEAPRAAASSDAPRRSRLSWKARRASESAAGDDRGARRRSGAR